jgi:hypothetical protein
MNAHTSFKNIAIMFNTCFGYLMLSNRQYMFGFQGTSHTATKTYPKASTCASSSESPASSSDMKAFSLRFVAATVGAEAPLHKGVHACTCDSMCGSTHAYSPEQHVHIMACKMQKSSCRFSDLGWVARLSGSFEGCPSFLPTVPKRSETQVAT